MNFHNLLSRHGFPCFKRKELAGLTYLKPHSQEMDLRFKPGTPRSATLFAGAVSASCSYQPCAPFKGQRAPRTQLQGPRGPTQAARPSPPPKPASSAKPFLSRHCRLSMSCGSPWPLPGNLKHLGLFSKVPSIPRPHLSLFPNTRSAPAKLVCLLSPRLCCRTGYFPCSWHSLPHLCCSVSFCKTPD